MNNFFDDARCSSRSKFEYSPWELAERWPVDDLLLTDDGDDTRSFDKRRDRVTVGRVGCKWGDKGLEVEGEGVSGVFEIGSKIIHSAYNETSMVTMEPSLCMFPPTPALNWVICRMRDLSKKMGICFEGMEPKVEGLFRESE